ncbi:polysaccharide pyruvyl transferase family protein [Providencia rettgeri]|uniref:polysaccharide pyruvyl transferase family protein n=1 Tax=Providencia rettgeri TaxID=587 RepID=UPI0018E4C770|nr:polysaccharide pyruvyl transferase family protein [Providencia rettgeri]MBI6191589.1 polysaccharide pyruvyl transferase family protein [Providencia rettgeri]
MTYNMKKILHIASFEGNIGDNASHLGFTEIFKILNLDIKIDRLEIRKSYNNYKKNDRIIFDDNFVQLANKYDYIIFGGGGFLDYWVDGSVNGTTINISNSILSKINTKILITSIGSNPHRKIPIGNIEKFKKFLDYAKENNNITIALRNDGSLESIKKDIGIEYSEIFESVLDHGFFYSPSQIETLPIDEKYVAINITADQIEMFSHGQVSVKDKNSYLKELSQLTQEIIDIHKLKIVFTSHIYSDLEAITELLKLIPDHYKRTDIIIAPFFQGDTATDYLFNIYHNSEYIIASRYHANVCAISQNKKVIGLSPLQRIEHIHRQFSFSDTSVSLAPGFKNKVLKLMESEISFNLIYLNELKEKTLNFYEIYFK